MIYLREPDAGGLRALRQANADLPFSYPEVGCTRGDVPAGYTRDHSRARLGTGLPTFTLACDALRRWQMLQLGWVRPCWTEVALEPGAPVGTLAHLFGIWFANVCRIVYVDETPGLRLTFAYGTVPGHVERGEERFTVERDAEDAVWFDILAYSRPASLLTYLGYPITRRSQRRFARDSLAAMVRATAAAGG